jgi:hypothetical protein
MAGNVVEFRNPTRPIAQFVRIDDAHRRYGDLYAAGRLPIRRAVFDASRITSQRELISALRRDGVEIVLDTEVAELASLAKYQTHVKKAPWASIAEGKILNESFFDGSFSQINLIKRIAEFAVENSVDTILAPTHFLGDRSYTDWITADGRSCVALRRALDTCGGGSISIDYPIIHSHVALNDAQVRSQIMERVAQLPFDNLWIRPSGLGSDPRSQPIKQFLKTLQDFHKLGVPIIIDYVDGLMAQALLAFGGASGIAHGIGERSHFEANAWHKEPKARDEDQSFGRTAYIVIPGLGRRLAAKELRVLAGAKGGRKLLGCQDPCCAHGLQSTLNEPRQHAAFHAIAPIQRLAGVPDLNRPRYFLDHPLREAEQLARNIKDLNPTKTECESAGVDIVSLKKRLTEHHRYIGKFSDTLSLLDDQREQAHERAANCDYRVGTGNGDVRREQK